MAPVPRQDAMVGPPEPASPRVLSGWGVVHPFVCRSTRRRYRKHVYGVPAMKKVFTTGQVAKICKVAPRTVSKWFDSGRLRGYRIPGSQDRRIPREQLIRFLKEHEIGRASCR